MELIKTWRSNGFTLRLWDTFKRHPRGTSMLKYQLKDGRRVVFEGDEFSASPMHCDDSLETVAAILGFLTVQRGDTDAEYFDNYTPEQLAWIETSRCEELSMVQLHMEERNEQRRRGRR